jgi:hypothetical protein
LFEGLYKVFFGTDIIIYFVILLLFILSPCVSQTHLELALYSPDLPQTGDPPASASQSAGIKGMNQHSWLH